MNQVPKIDKRRKEDLIKEIKQKASVYVPEWRFNEEKPDAGTALALIYADMLTDTIEHFNKIPEKSQLAFLDKIQTKLKSAVPAEGFVTFQLVNDEVEGCPVPHGTPLLADTDEGETCSFETVEDVYVTPSSIEDIYLSIPSEDKIFCLYERTEENAIPGGFFLFDSYHENMQKHCMYFYDSSILKISGGAWITIDLRGNVFETEEKDILLKQFLDKNMVEISYYSEEGFLTFEAQKLDNGKLMLQKSSNQPPFAPYSFQQDMTGYCIKMEFRNVAEWKGTVMERLCIRSSGETKPQLIYADGAEQAVREFLPFGERPMPYAEFYVTSDEVFSKQNAFVHMDFDIDFVSVPLENSVENEQQVNWKMIMKRQDIKVNKEYDISIGEVIWEYYNGEGFRRLFVNQQYADAFSIEEGTGRRCVSIRFICPEDMHPFLVNSQTSCCIRARITRMNNFYKMQGNYITPRISLMKLRYEYNRDDMLPVNLIVQNNMETNVFSRNLLMMGTEKIVFIRGREEKQRTMYFGFTHPLENGPVKLLYVMAEAYLEKFPNIGYEYYSRGKWKNLNMVDGTEHFRKTGIISLMGQNDFTKQTFFGKERFWIRMTDYEGMYERAEVKKKRPYLKGIYLNSTAAKGVETMEAELFYVRPNQDNLVCHLNHDHVCEIEVWADEKKRITLQEKEVLRKQNCLRETHDENGEVREVWVRWTETEHFLAEKNQGRVYVVDRNEGVLCFPNGRNGMIPPDGLEATIQVLYKVTEAEKGNVEAGRVNKLASNIGYISEVVNREEMTGGLRQETMKEAIERKEAFLRHRNRAVTEKDYENLAKEAVRNIIKAKCFSNYNQYGEKQYGAVTLVLLQRNFETGSMQFDHIREWVMEYLRPRMPEELLGRNAFHIIEPDFIEIHVTATIYMSDFSRIFEVRNQVNERLKRFLNPVTGNFNSNGFDIGTLPREIQILNIIQEIPNIKSVRNIRLSANRYGKEGHAEIDLERTDNMLYMLARSGTHHIQIQMEE